MTDDEPISQGEFPSDLEQVPLDERVPVALGWTPLAASVALLGFAILFFDMNRVNSRTLVTAPISPKPWFEGIYGIIAAAVLLGVVLLLYEVLRRLNRTVLAGRKELIGIYRKSKLVQTISANEVVYYKLSWWNNVWYILSSAALTFAILPLWRWSQRRTRSHYWVCWHLPSRRWQLLLHWSALALCASIY